MLEAWAIKQGVQRVFIRPGRPEENGFIESFNGRFPDEFLNVEWFASLEEARHKLSVWPTITTISGHTTRCRIALRQPLLHCTERQRAGASLSPSPIEHSVSQVPHSSIDLPLLATSSARQELLNLRMCRQTS